MVAGRENSLRKSCKCAVWNSEGGGCGGRKFTQQVGCDTELCSVKGGEGMSKKPFTPITIPICLSEDTVRNTF